MSIIGHELQRELLEQTASSAVLLQGPSGVGKWLVAQSHADDRQGAAMILRDGPTVEQARSVVQLYEQRQLGVSSTVTTLVDLDECSAAVQNTLLKTVEEMPEWGQIVFVTSGRVLPTIRSRCTLIHFFAMPDVEVVQVLQQEGVSAAEAEVLAKVAGGSPGRALEIQSVIRRKPEVLSYIDSLIRHDAVAISTMLKRLDKDAESMLWRWCMEVLMDWSAVFSKEELSLVHKLGVRRFYMLVECLSHGDSLDLAAQKVWALR